MRDDLSRKALQRKSLHVLLDGLSTSSSDVEQAECSAVKSHGTKEVGELKEREEYHYQVQVNKRSLSNFYEQALRERKEEARRKQHTQTIENIRLTE